MTYDPYDHRPPPEGVAHARAESRPRRDSDQLVAGFAVFVGLVFFVVAALLLHELVPGGIRP